MTSGLTEDQRRAHDEILAATGRGERYLLTGYAGSGKTFLMQRLTHSWRMRGLRVALTAPTHKAVAVLKRKLQEAKIEEVPCLTVFSLLGLRPKIQADREVYVRDKRAQAVTTDVVVIDECSMLGEDLMAHIRRHLPLSFVLFVGDPAQLPPVGEAASQAFEVKRRSHLSTIVRQSAENPLLAAAHAIREGQGKPVDWSWCRSAAVPPLGVYLPGAAADDWMRQGFLSPAFEENPDNFRYLAWTNARVHEVNQKIRRWRYGDRALVPFVPGEFALIRKPILLDKTVLFSTNEEAEVNGIERSSIEHYICKSGDCAGWMATVPTWRVTLLRKDFGPVPVEMVADAAAYQRVIARITDEATAGCRDRWEHLFEFKESLANLQSIYAMTVHTSQGSTFRNAFVDIPDIRRRAASNPLEMQQMLYVAATRPSRALVLVGA
ncbi:ATP-dependent DNA helicase [Roseococcus sp. YIM B11640]|uniref:ATP-dependent DNA helicase n=1 Tax=Roseococcus sp. YIM B11640 TaxID=3133973 RepID=UPI003C7B8728